MLKAALVGDNPALIDRVYGQGRRARLATLVDLHPEVVTGAMLREGVAAVRDVDVWFSTWGFPQIDAATLAAYPKVQAVFYAAGSVRAFAPPLLARGITLVSAWGANAVPVAEFTLAQILLSCKGYFRNSRECRVPECRRTGQVYSGPGVFGEAVALLGAGMIGRKVIELLKPFTLQILVFDPFLSPAQAGELGVEQVSLDEAFARGFVVSNHLANLPETRGMLTGAHFAAMRPHATFINTGRGATVDERALTRVLTERPDLTALLDVTDPEPPPADSPLYRLPNVQLSSHIAGSLGDEVVRMADYCLEEFLAWQDGRPLRYAVSEAMLATMA
jgi:phosphoglycerate dehydrogenase-like enzyme